MSDHPDTDALREADYQKYGDDDYVPVACYMRMATHAAEMEASAKAAARMLGEAWEDVKRQAEQENKVERDGLVGWWKAYLKTIAVKEGEP